MSSSSTSSVSSMVNSRLRMTGLSSGLDIDGMVQKLMTAEKAPLNKLKQKMQIQEWVRDDYRSVSSALKGFYTSYLDSANSSTNFTSATAFGAFKASSTSDSLVTATTKSGAVPGTHTIVVKQTATAAKINGNTVTKSVISSGAPVDTSALQGKQINVTLDGVTKTIDLTDAGTVADLVTNLNTALKNAFGTDTSGNNKISVGDAGGGKLKFTTSLNGSTFRIVEAPNNYINALGYTSGQKNYFTGSDVSTSNYSIYNGGTFKINFGGTDYTIDLNRQPTSVSDLKDLIQSRIDAIVGSNKIGVSEAGGKLTFTSCTGEPMTLSSGSTNNVLGYLGISSGSAVTGTGSADINISANEKGKSFTLNIDGSDKTIIIDQDYTTVNDLANYLNTQLSGNGVTVTTNGNKLVFGGVGGQSHQITFKSGPQDSLASLGFAAGDNTSNKVSLGAKLDSAQSSFSTPLDASYNSSNNVAFTINGVNIDLKKSYANTSIQDIMNAVNASSAGVQMSYDSLNDKFSLVSRTEGATSTISITDNSEGLLKSLGIVGGTTTQGRDAIFDMDTSTDMVRSSNQFTIDGVNYTLKGDIKSGDPVQTATVTVNADVDSVVTNIKNFVSKYNDMLDTINKLLSEKRYRDYAPLTDDQKDAMKDDDITRWNEKAKSGLLNSDSALSGIVTSMRNAMYSSVSGLTINLSSIGITTGSYLDKGKLVIDETKLRNAITQNPDQIIQLFTQNSDTSYYEAMDDSTKRKTRNSETGLAWKLSDVIQDNIRTFKDAGGNKGILLEKAGVVGDSSEFDNTIYDALKSDNRKLTELTKKLSDKEEYYYQKFSAMETALSKMNSQSSWLSQQFGQG